jgi:hypothetical protein
MISVVVMPGPNPMIFPPRFRAELILRRGFHFLTCLNSSILYICHSLYRGRDFLDPSNSCFSKSGPYILDQDAAFHPILVAFWVLLLDEAMPHDLPSITSSMPPMTKGCRCSDSSSVGPSKILLPGTATATGTTGLGSINPRPRPIPLTFCDSDSSSKRARSVAEGRLLNRTGLLVYECMERGERERVRVVVQVLERVKAAPRRED